MKIDLSLMPPSKDEIEAEYARNIDNAKSTRRRIRGIAIICAAIIMMFNVFVVGVFGKEHLPLLLTSNVLYLAWLFAAYVSSDDDKVCRNGVYVIALMFLSTYQEQFVALIVAIFYVAMFLPFSLIVSLKNKKSTYQDNAKGMEYIENHLCEYVLRLKNEYPLINSYMKSIQEIGRRVTYVEVVAMSEHESYEKERIKQEKYDAACKELYFGEMMTANS